VQTGRQAGRDQASLQRAVANQRLGGLRDDAFSVHRHAKQGAETEEIAAGSDAGASGSLKASLIIQPTCWL